MNEEDEIEIVSTEEPPSVCVYHVTKNRRRLLFGNYDTSVIPTHLSEEELYKIAKEVLKIIGQLKANYRDKNTESVLENFLTDRIDNLVNKFFNLK